MHVVMRQEWGRLTCGWDQVAQLENDKRDLDHKLQETQQEVERLTDLHAEALLSCFVPTPNPTTPTPTSIWEAQTSHIKAKHREVTTREGTRDQVVRLEQQERGASNPTL